MSIAKTLEYRHYFDPVPLDFNFDNKFKYKLVESELELCELLSKAKDSIISFDTETNGLDYLKNHIVGFSFSFDAFSGYYVPLRHQKRTVIERKVDKIDEDGNIVYSKRNKNQPLQKKVKEDVFEDYETNLNPDRCLSILHKALCEAKLVLMHNAIFDTMMLKREGLDCRKIKIFDTMCLTYNADTNATGFFGLKPASELFLGRRPLKFKEVIGKEKTFKYIDPKDSVYYASLDSANTYGLFQKLYPILKSEGCSEVLKMDNSLVKCFIDYYTENPIYIDKKVMAEYRFDILKRKEHLELSIFEAVGYPFNIRSKSKELPEALKSLGINTGVFTETGAMSTSKEALQNVIDKHPMVKQLIELSSLEKQLNSYIDKLAEATPYKDNPDIGEVRVNYKLFGTASGRLASGNGVKSKSDENDYFINLNIQNLTKPKPAMYEAIKISDNIEEGILGWEFKLVDDSYIKNNPDKYYVEGQSPEINVRRAITVKDKSEIITSIDFSAQELKLAGIITGEPNFIEPFKKGEDVHTNMAKKLFGESNYDKNKRKSAKVANFGLLYGGNAYVLKSVAQQQGLELTDDEAFELYNKWWEANFVLKNWQQYKLNQVMNDDKFVIKDLFGRPRRLKHYLTSEDRGVFNFGKRTISSHAVQGTGASIMRRLLINMCHKYYNNPQYNNPDSPNYMRYLSSVHDELNTVMKKKNAVNMVRLIEDEMIYQPKGFPIPIDCSIELGDSLGTLFPFVWKDETRTSLIPKRI